MKERKLALLILVFLGLMLTVYLTSKQGPTAAGEEPGPGSKIFPNLPVNKIAKIVCQSPDGIVSYAKVDGTWRALETYGYPADFARIRDFVLGLAELKVGQVMRIDEQQRKELELVSPVGKEGEKKVGTLITLLGRKDNEVATMLLGKTHKSQSDINYGSSVPDELGGMPNGRYVAVGDNVYLVADMLRSEPLRSEAWINRDLLDVYSGGISEIVSSGPGRKAFKLVRHGRSPDMELEGIGEREIPDLSNMGGISGGFSYLRFESVADPALSDAQAGLDNPVVVKAKTEDGMIYTLLIGKETEDGKGSYARVSAVFEEPVAEPRESEEEDEYVAKKRVEISAKLAVKAEEINSRHGQWTYILRKNVAKYFLFTRDDMIKEVLSKKRARELAAEKRAAEKAAKSGKKD